MIEGYGMLFYCHISMSIENDNFIIINMKCLFRIVHSDIDSGIYWLKRIFWAADFPFFILGVDSCLCDNFSPFR